MRAYWVLPTVVLFLAGCARGLPSAGPVPARSAVPVVVVVPAPPRATVMAPATAQALQPAAAKDPAPAAPAADAPAADAPAADAEAGVVRVNDAHLHLLNYAQHGTTIDDFLKMVGDRVERVALFGIPVQQKWDYFVSGDRAPDYYLHSDAPLYYYSFVDAMIAHEYLSLTQEQKRRVDPLLCGFNPTDMYAPEHIERVLLMYPGVFSGIGEFSVHKEFVSSKVTGHTASLRNEALDAVFDKAEEIGLVVLLHCDVDAMRSTSPRTAHFDDLVKVFSAHPGTTIIWAHTGLGRYVGPTEQHVDLLEEMLSNPRCAHVVMDLAWDEVAKWIVEDEASIADWAALIARHPTRFLFGSDAVAPKSWAGYEKTCLAYEPLCARLDAATRARVERLNYVRVFDEAKPRIRAWEQKKLAEIGRSGRHESGVVPVDFKTDAEK